MRAWTEKITEQVSRLLENWQPYCRAKEQLFRILEGDGPAREEDRRQTLLSSYEVAVILAAYLSRFQDGHSGARRLESPQFVQEILGSMEPLE